MKERVNFQWIKRMLFKSSNKLLCILICLVCSSCEEQDVLTKENVEDLKIILNCNSISEKHEENFNFIEVQKSKLKTSFGKKMGASVSSLILYNRIYDVNSSLEFNSHFGVRFLEDSSEYKYSLSQLSSVSTGKKEIEIVLEMILSEHKEISQVETYTGVVEQHSIKWNDANLYGILGFEFAKVNYLSEELDCVLFRYQLEPINKEVWVYYSIDKNSIVSIIDPVKSIGKQSSG